MDALWGIPVQVCYSGIMDLTWPPCAKFGSEEGPDWMRGIDRSGWIVV